MDVGAFFASLGAFDLLAFIAVGLGIVSGFIQGPVRRILGIVITVFVLLFAVNLRVPVGSFLAQYWSQDTVEYARFIAAGACFAILYVTAMLAAQVYLKPGQLFAGTGLSNEIVGGVLGAIEAIVLLGVVILVMDSYFRAQIVPPSPNEIGILRDFFAFYDNSLTAHVYREWLIPGFLFPFGWAIPDSMRILIVR